MTHLAGSAHESGHHETANPAFPDFNTRWGQWHFLLRRIHSLAGIAFGGFIVVHLAVNASGLWPRDYQLNVDKIHNLEPSLSMIEIATIFSPLLLHMLYGVYVAFAGVKYNTLQYNYGGNVRYFLQRWTSIVLVLFVLFHIATLHKWGFHLVYQVTHMKSLEGYAQLGLFNPDNQAFQSTVAGIRNYWNPTDPLNPGNVMVMAFYLLGVWAAVFHFANGLWTAAIAWGLTVTATAQRRWGHVCLALGAALFVVGTVAWAAFTIAPAAQGDLSRWNMQTRTHDYPDKAAVGEPSGETRPMAKPPTNMQP